MIGVFPCKHRYATTRRRDELNRSAVLKDVHDQLVHARVYTVLRALLRRDNRPLVRA